MPFAALAERGAGYDRDLLLAEQAFAERLGGEAGRDDGGEHIERALRLKARQPHRAELAEQIAAADVVLCAHALDIVLAGRIASMPANCAVVGADMMPN